MPIRGDPFSSDRALAEMHCAVHRVRTIVASELYAEPNATNGRERENGWRTTDATLRDKIVRGVARARALARTFELSARPCKNGAR